MSINRRFVLKSVALGGSMPAWGISLSTLANGLITPTRSTQPVLALVNGNDRAADSLFLQGATAATASTLPIQRVNLDLDFMRALERQMRLDSPLRVIGLLNDASATLVVDMARSAGARVQWLGQHSAGPDITHHRLLTTEASTDCSRQLGYQLQACGAAFSLQEESMNSAMTVRQLSRLSQQNGQPAQWLGSLGYALASLGTSTSMMAPPLGSAANMPLSGSFVSFSIEV